MSPEQCEQLLAILTSISESLRILCNAVEHVAQNTPTDEEG